MKSNAETILEAIEDLHNQEQIVTRETLSQLTGFKLSIVDDRLSHLVDSFLNGVCRHEPRLIEMMWKLSFLNGVCRHELQSKTSGN